MAGIAALRNTYYSENMKNLYKTRRDFLVDGLNKINNISCLLPGGAFYVFPNITKTGMTSYEVVELLMNNGVVTLPGTCFGEYGEGYIRLCYANSLENIEKSVNIIKGVLS
jgi:aspartate/methionine/tyrosine aminotransferase